MKLCGCGRGVYLRWFRGRARWCCLGSHLPKKDCRRAAQLVFKAVLTPSEASHAA